METLFIDKEIKYTGRELAPHWIYKNFKIQGDAIIGFIGEVEVNLDEMVDIEDVINNEPIYSQKMLNFIIEQFDISLFSMVALQRLFISIIKDVIEEETNKKLIRQGDDLYFDERKLSVSIATKSITSCLIHTGLNIIKENAPIKASDLSEIGVNDIKNFATIIMKRYAQEIKSIKMAISKVRGV